MVVFNSGISKRGIDIVLDIVLKMLLMLECIYV